MFINIFYPKSLVLKLFRAWLADFYRPPLSLAARRREIRRREKQVKRKQRRRVQGSGGAHKACPAVFPPPPHLLIRTGERGTGESPPSPPHLQLLQFSETGENLHNGLYMEVKSRKTDIRQWWWLLLPFSDRTPVSRDIDCWSLVSEILAGANILLTPIFCDILAWQASTTRPGQCRRKSAR